MEIRSASRQVSEGRLCSSTISVLPFKRERWYTRDRHKESPSFAGSVDSNISNMLQIHTKKVWKVASLPLVEPFRDPIAYSPHIGPPLGRPRETAPGEGSRKDTASNGVPDSSFHQEHSLRTSTGGHEFVLYGPRIACL